MRLWNWVTRKRTDRGWPGYMINGRIRTSTAALILAFFVISWLQNTYNPAPQPAQVPASQIVPPGFVPDPDYTWVPRTQVEQAPRTIYRTATPTRTTERTPTETPSPTETTSPGETTSTTPTTTVTDPDGPGPLPPTTLTDTPTTTTTGPSTVPNRSGTPTPTPGLPGLPGTAPTTPVTTQPAPLFP